MPESASVLSGRSIERRQLDRIPCQLQAVVCDSSGQNHGVQTVCNVSQGGLCVESSVPMQVGQKYSYLVDLLPHKITLEGVIVHESNFMPRLRRVGVKLVDIDHAATDFLTSYIIEQQVFHDRWVRSEPPTPLLTVLEPFLSHQESELLWPRHIALGPELEALHRRYSEVGDRDCFLWKWAYCACHLTSIGSVPDRNRISKTKVKAIMLNVLVDDIVDKCHDANGFDLAYRFLTDVLHLSDLDPGDPTYRYFTVVRDVHAAIKQDILEYPQYEQLKHVLQFDWDQFFNAMRYTLVAQSVPEFANMTEYYLYQSHNMNMMINATIDLMAHTTFDFSELGRIRQIVLQAQKLVRIGNMIVTWERELKENDYSSGLFAYAVAQKIISHQDLKDGKKEHIKEEILQSACQTALLREWIENYDQLITMYRASPVQSVDLAPLVENMPRLLISLHLSSRGFV